MLDDTNRFDTNQQVAQGTPVYDVNGDKVGTVADLDQANNAMVIQKGLFFPKDIQVPLSTVARSDADGVYLSVTKDDVSNGNFASSGASGYDTDRGVDTQAPYNATPARSVGDADLNARAATTPNTARDDLARGADHPTPVRDGDIAVPVREEELVAGKQREETGRVHVGKDVVEEQQSLNVPVTHEEVQVERVPVDKDIPADRLGADAWQNKDIVVPVMGEQVNSEKRAHVNEEIHLHKQAVTENQQVSDTIRKEKVHIDGADDADVANTSDRLSDDTPMANP